MNVSAGIAERGHNYYTENRVRYISLDGSKGYAIVEGSTAYEVEFEYRDGTISGLICSCFWQLQLQARICGYAAAEGSAGPNRKNYADQYARTGYFAAVDKGALFAFAIAGKEAGSLTL